MQRVQATGDVSPAQFGGYKVSPLAAHEADLRRWVAERSDITIAELQSRLLERGTKTSPAALARFLAKLGLTRKKRRHGPPSSRAMTSPRPARPGSDGSVDCPQKLVFVDETWTSTNMAPRHGRATEG